MATYLDDAQLSGRTYFRTEENRARIGVSGREQRDDETTPQLNEE